MLLVSLPRSERVPPLIFRLTTGGRRLRSAALLSALARGSATKVNSSGRKRSTRWVGSSRRRAKPWGRFRRSPLERAGRGTGRPVGLDPRRRLPLLPGIGWRLLLAFQLGDPGF